MTICRLYAENGNRAGFWVQHRDWTNFCAQVQSIAGQREGKLPDSVLKDVAVAVLMCAFDVRSGRPVPIDPAAQECHDRNYARIAEPYWHHDSR